jgi:3-hydroxyacyl-CoA dehydrogenase
MGLMGHGIIQVSAEAGFEVHGIDASADGRKAGMQRISSSLEKQASKAVAKGKATEEEAAANMSAVLGRVSHGETYDGLADCDLIIEALPENVELKRKMWASVEELLAASDAKPILASNTSSLQLRDMSVSDPSRLVGLHFFNPVQLMRLVEVVRGDETKPEVFDTAAKYVDAIGKTAVQCGDTPGFVVNRLLVPYMAQVRTAFVWQSGAVRWGSEESLMEACCTFSVVLSCRLLLCWSAATPPSKGLMPL